MCHIFLDGFWWVHIPYGSMIKFQFLAQFSVDHLSHPVSHIVLQHEFAAFAYYVINHFVSITLAILLHIIDFCFIKIGPYRIVLCCKEKRFSFSLRIFPLVAMSKSSCVRFSQFYKFFTLVFFRHWNWIISEMCMYQELNFVKRKVHSWYFHEKNPLLKICLLVSLFNGIWAFVGYLMPKPSL